jgi:hypothetical protein
LGIHKTFYEAPEYSSFHWYNRGLGSFHAFHAAIVLFVALVELGAGSEHHEIKLLLENTVLIFNAMASRSRICAKASSILASLL